jgi:hypothetical protein
VTLSLRFPESRWEAVEHNWAAWWAGELERPLVVLECAEPDAEQTPHYASTFLTNYALEMPADDLLDLFVPRLEATHYVGDAFPRFWPNLGPGIVAAFAGAQVHPAPDTTWFSPGRSGPISALHVACDPRNVWWRRVLDITQTAVERWGRQLAVGLTDLGGNLDIVASLRGTERLLFDLCDAPEEVDRLVAETTRTWLGCYNELAALIRSRPGSRPGRGFTCWGPCWSPGRGYMLQSDLAYMISPRMFERFVLPDLAACCEALDYAFYHLDGKGQIAHLDHVLSLARLRGIQWVPGDGTPPPERWLPLLQRIRDGGKLCQVYVSAQGALTIARELGGQGFLFVINETLMPDQGAELLRQLA